MSDTMLLGVLRMPFDLAMATPTARIQYHQQGVQAADEIEKRTRERDEALAEVERLRAENERLTRECAAEWEPIETAPRDGTTILVYFRWHGPMTVVANDQNDPDADWRLWYIDDHKHGPYVVRGYCEGDDTHWMPLPEPPKALEGNP